MGRKPNAVIAEHFVRGQKHGRTTNRYAQTCTHCNQFFSTGRPETLFAHLAGCPGLTQVERTDVIHRIYNNDPIDLRASSTNAADKPQTSSRIDDFDITGLNVLAGAAENAEDMVIDPHIARYEPVEHATQSEGQLSQFYESQYETAYPQNTSSSNTWPYAFAAIHDLPSPYPDIAHATPASTDPDVVQLPVTQWSFAPIITPPVAYMRHPSPVAPISFADDDRQQSLDSNNDSHDGSLSVIGPGRAKIRKIKQPYDEPMRARVAAMRHIGACIRCSRLRKTCEPTRPCSACKDTASKTWIGACTSLDKGREFTAWYEPRLNRISTTQIEFHARSCDNSSPFVGKLEVKFFGRNGPKASLDLTQANAMGGTGENSGASGQRLERHFFIDSSQDVAHKLLDHAVEWQELIIDEADLLPMYITARVAQGLSVQQDEQDSVVWGSARRSDTRLGRLYKLWLVTSLLTLEKFRPFISVVDASGQRVEDTADVSYENLVLQIDAALENIVSQHRDDFRRFDADILNQGYKHLFNLVIGIVLILDVVEKYCCFLRHHPAASIVDDVMLMQARTIADKYAYCIQNIQMLPAIRLGEQSTMIAIDDGKTKIDHEMQRVWVQELCMSDTDLETYLNDVEDDEWLSPTGRLWARIFRRLQAK